VAAEFTVNKQPYAVFIDNNLGSRRDYLQALCSALRPLKKIWSAAVSIDVTDDPDLIRNMALAGCTGVLIGFADWVEANRLECATFHILTPYPATPLFLQLEAQGRLPTSRLEPL
jgi:hypothetical protein